MQPDVYRTKPPRDEAAAARKRASFEELVVPLLALMLGGLLIVVSLGGAGGGTPRPTEGGLGTVVVLFGLYALRQAVETLRRPSPRHVDDAG